LVHVVGRRSACRAATAFIFIAILGFALAATARASSNPTVAVTTTPGAALNAQLSTNYTWSGEIPLVPNGPTELSALNAPLVRLHAGDDGSQAMPEIKKGQWDDLDGAAPFTRLNALVNDVFASGQEPLMNIRYAPDWMW